MDVVLELLAGLLTGSGVTSASQIGGWRPPGGS